MFSDDDDETYSERFQRAPDIPGMNMNCCVSYF